MCIYKNFCVFPSRADFVRSIHPFRSLSPKNQGFETSLDARFKRFVLLFLLCLMLCSIFDLIFKSVNGCRAEVECNRLEFPLAKSKEKLLLSKRYAPSFRLQCGLRVRFFHCLLLQPFREISLRP